MLLALYFAASAAWQVAHCDEPMKRPAVDQYRAPVGICG
jgi:hypothetical protein